MCDHDCAAVPVTDSGRLVGIITDRDITCRAVARMQNAEEQPVESIMTRPVITADADEPLEYAAALMETNSIHHLPVIGPGGALIGMLAQSDIGRRMTNREFGRMARSTSIKSRAMYVRSASLVRRES